MPAIKTRRQRAAKQAKKSQEDIYLEKIAVDRQVQEQYYQDKYLYSDR